MRLSDRRYRAFDLLRSLLFAATCAACVGCASTRPTGSVENQMQSGSPDRDSDSVGVNIGSGVASSERRPRDYPEIETDEAGFTITEQIRIGGEVREDYQSALQLFAQRRYDQGIALLISVTEEAPEVTAPYIDLGIAYVLSGDLERAEAVLQTAAQLSPGHPIAHNELGIIYRKTGRFEEARASYERALETYPGFHYARRNLGVLCDLYLADLMCALEQYEAYMHSVLEDSEVDIWIADIRNRIGQQESVDGS